MRCESISDNPCLTSNGARPSRKQPDRRPRRLILRSASRKRRPPPPLDTRPAVNRHSPRREKWAVNENDSWIPSVIKGRSFSWHSTTPEQRSYAIKTAAFCYLFLLPNLL